MIIPVPLQSPSPMWKCFEKIVEGPPETIF